MEDIRELKGSVSALVTTFTQQMAAYEEKLQNQNDSPATSTVTSTGLAADFASFKSFVLIALKALQEQIQLTAQAVDQLEMRNRRKILLIHGVTEQKNEETATVVAKVAVAQLKFSDFSSKDISRCHRMGRSSPDRPRPILVKLRDVSLRDKLWLAKTNLRSSGITVSEFLTRPRHEVFMQARQRFGITKCWTREGNIFVAGPDDTRHRVSCLADLYLISAQSATAETSQVRPAPAKEPPTSSRPKRVASSRK